MRRLLLFQENMMASNFSHHPYQACLIPNLHEEIQHRVRDIGNYVVRPLDMLLAVTAFVCNALILSVTDLIYSLFSLYVSIKTLLREHMCLGYLGSRDTAVITLCSLTTLGTLAVISRDRYLAVTKPLWYRNHLSTSRAIKMSCVPWLISMVITLVHVIYFVFKFDGKYQPLVHTTSLVYYCICFVIIIFSHLGIYFQKPLIADIREIQAVMKREKKTAATVRLILLVLLLTFLPAFLCPVVFVLKGVGNLGAYRPFYFILFTLNAFANPLLNFGRNKDMRRALRGLLQRFRHVHQQQQEQRHQQQ